MHEVRYDAFQLRQHNATASSFFASLLQSHHQIKSMIIHNETHIKLGSISSYHCIN